MPTDTHVLKQQSKWSRNPNWEGYRQTEPWLREGTHFKLVISNKSKRERTQTFCLSPNTFTFKFLGRYQAFPHFTAFRS